MPSDKELPPGYWDKPCSLWQRLPYRSDTGGISPMTLEGMEQYTNFRIAGMSPDRRAWRKQWLEDQVLTHREPVHVPEHYTYFYNPFRRFFKWPLNKIYDFVEPYTNPYFARGVRRYVSWTFRGVLFMYVVTYYFMYRQNDWTRRGGLTALWPKPIVYPGEPGYPAVSQRSTPEDYYDMGYRSTVLYKSPEKIKAEYEKELAEQNRIKYVCLF